MNTREALKLMKQLSDTYTDLEKLIDENFAASINEKIKDAQRAIAWQLVHMSVDWSLASDENTAIYHDNDIPF